MIFIWFSEGLDRSRVLVRELSYLASELQILDLQLNDEGIYTCAVGPLSTTQEVFIEGKYLNGMIGL